MIAQKFVFSIDFVSEGNTGCRSEEISFRVGTRVKRKSNYSANLKIPVIAQIALKFSRVQGENAQCTGVHEHFYSTRPCVPPFAGQPLAVQKRSRRFCDAVIG